MNCTLKVRENANAWAPSQATITRCPISGGTCLGECVFASVVDAQRLGVVIFDPERSSLFFVNRYARELFRRVKQPITYEALRALLLTENTEGDTDHTARQLRLGTRLLGYTVYRAKSFDWVYVRDITKKARLESIAEAVVTMNNIGYVFTGVRHELGNPINTIKTALSVLRANLESYSIDTVAEYLGRIASEVSRVESLLRSLKSFSLYEEPELRPLDMVAFVAQFAKLVSDQAFKDGITLEISTCEECWALCDPRALQQVMLNLLANASDALRNQRAPALRILLSKGDGLVSLRMADNGLGVAKNEVQNLFKPLFTTKTGGTGLGLVISRKLLAKMNGAISLESMEGKGTVVHVTLPETQAGAVIS